MLCTGFPSEVEIANERRRQFRLAIDKKAADLSRSKRDQQMQRATALEPEAIPAEPDPPAPVYCIRCACLVEGGVLTIKNIKLAVAREFGLTFAELSSPRRDVYLVRARFAAMWLCKELMPLKSFPEIGRQFGGRDHTTVMSACSRFRKYREIDPVLAARVEKIRFELTAGAP